MINTVTTTKAPPGNHDVAAPIALYVHIPFCLSKCNYCDFNTYEGIEALMPTFVAALSDEIALWADRLGRPRVSSIFFGGGTPSYLPSNSISELLRHIQQTMRVNVGAEITLEANPDDLSAEKAEAWLAVGFNRVSIGVQSFDNRILVSLSRRHTADAACQAVETARKAGFENISIDLMFGLPQQSLSDWSDTLNRAVGLGTEHLSLYGLQIEPGTPLHRDVQIGTIPTPSDDLAADMYEMAMDALDEARYEHYEISNWAKPGHRSQHNLAYWLNQPYLGVGPGAHSSLNGRRFANMKSPRRYIHVIESADQSPAIDPYRITEGDLAVDFMEVTSLKTSMSETMMLGMRLAEGVSRTEFQRRFGSSMGSVYGPEIEFLTNAGLIEHRNDNIALTRRGKLLGNSVFEQFVITDED